MTVYIVVAIVTLALIAGWLVYVGRVRPRARLSRLAMLAFLLVLAGIIFGESRVVGYSLIGVGVLIAVIDIVRTWDRA